MGVAALVVDNITAAIADGLYQPSMKERLDELEAEKVKTEVDLKTMTEVQPEIPAQITEGMIRATLTQFQEFVRTQNIPEVTRFIRSYVERVEVGRDEISVTFKAAFSFTHGLEPMTFTETHPIKPLHTEYRAPRARAAI